MARWSPPTPTAATCSSRPAESSWACVTAGTARMMPPCCPGASPPSPPSRTPWPWMWPWAAPPTRCCTCWRRRRRPVWTSPWPTWTASRARCPASARWPQPPRTTTWRTFTAPGASSASWASWIGQGCCTAMQRRCMRQPSAPPSTSGMSCAMGTPPCTASLAPHRAGCPLRRPSPSTAATRVWTWTAAGAASGTWSMPTAARAAWRCSPATSPWTAAS